MKKENNKTRIELFKKIIEDLEQLKTTYMKPIEIQYFLIGYFNACYLLTKEPLFYFGQIRNKNIKDWEESIEEVLKSLEEKENGK